MVTVVLENKVVINFDFRHGAKKSGHLDNPLQSYGKICFNIFQYILRKAGLIWFNTSWIKNKNIFINDMTWAIPSLRSEKFRKPEPPEKSVSFRKCDFSGA